MSFHAGQLVVCVDDGPWPGAPGLAVGYGNLRRGTVYTIIKVAPHLWSVANADGVLGVWLAEIDRPFNVPYGASRFRPVDEKRIEVFRKIAANPRVEVGA